MKKQVIKMDFNKFFWIKYKKKHETSEQSFMNVHSFSKNKIRREVLNVTQVMTGQINQSVFYAFTLSLEYE